MSEDINDDENLREVYKKYLNEFPQLSLHILIWIILVIFRELLRNDQILMEECSQALELDKLLRLHSLMQPRFSSEIMKRRNSDGKRQWKKWQVHFIKLKKLMPQE